MTFSIWSRLHFFDKPMWHARNHDYGFAIHRSDRLIAISDFEKRNLLAYFGKREVDVVHHSGYLADHICVAPKNSTLLDTLKNKDYCLYPAIPWPHKNHTNLLNAWRILKTQTQRSLGNLKLVLTGALEHGHVASSIKREIESLGLQEDVVVAGFQDDGAQARLISGAKLLLFPTLYEGFGIPVLEAMQMGTPVLATRLPSIVEFGGDSIQYFNDPYNSYAIANDIITSLEKQQALNAKANHAKAAANLNYTSEIMASRTLDCLQRAVDQKKNGRVEPFSITRTPGVIKPSAAAVIRVDDEFSDDSDIGVKIAAIASKISELKRFTDSVFIFNSDSLSDQVQQRLLALCQATDTKMRVFQANRAGSFASALEHIFAISDRPDYIYLTSDLHNDPTADELKTALTELNFFPDLGASALNSAQAGSFSRIVRPVADIEGHEKYLERKRDPLRPFNGWILRTEIFKSHGHPGSLKFLAGIISSVSFIECPTIATK
jgi:hypothetical protein